MAYYTRPNHKTPTLQQFLKLSKQRHDPQKMRGPQTVLCFFLLKTAAIYGQTLQPYF